jgi:hypothetical protein
LNQKFAARFLSANSAKFRKTLFKIRIQGKKKFVKHVPNFLTKGKIGIGEENFPFEEEAIILS